jgi:hypothetical protein
MDKGLVDGVNEYYLFRYNFLSISSTLVENWEQNI